MIENKHDLDRYLQADRLALGYKSSFVNSVKLFFGFYPNYKFIRILRYLEFLINSHNRFLNFLSHVYYIRFVNYRTKVGCLIEPNSIDEGLNIAHIGGIIINGNVKIGKNFSIRPYSVIGNKADGKNKEIPIIGDNVSVGCNCSIIGNVRIGSNVVIGAGSVVISDVPDNCIVVGNPARVVKKNDIGV